MRMVLTVINGFVTNSSSVINGFNRAVLEDPEVKAFIEKYEISDTVGYDIWHRGQCASIAISQAGVADLAAAFADGEYETWREHSFNKDMVYVVYGDEYDSFAHEFACVLVNASERLGLPHSSDDFN